MNVEPIIFVELVITIFILSVTIVVTVVYFSKLVKKLIQTNKDKSSILDEATNKAVRIIDEANNKSLDIIQKANLFVGEARDDLNDQLKNVTSIEIKEFEKATSDFMKLYSLVLQDLKSKNIEVFQNVSKDIEVNTIAEIKNFKESMEGLTVSSEKLVQKKIDSDYFHVKKEIQNYKETALKKIDQGIYELLEKVCSLVLGKALSLSEHEDLIRKSLEKAKKEGTFGK